MSSLVCPRCKSKNVKIDSLIAVTPELKCNDCGLVWTPRPEAFGDGLHGSHERDEAVKFPIDLEPLPKGWGDRIQYFVPLMIMILVALLIAYFAINNWPADFKFY